MTWNIQEIPDYALRLISVDGLVAATLSALISETGCVVEPGEAVLRGETMQLNHKKSLTKQSELVRVLQQLVAAEHASDYALYLAFFDYNWFERRICRL